MGLEWQLWGKWNAKCGDDDAVVEVVVVKVQNIQHGKWHYMSREL